MQAINVSSSLMRNELFTRTTKAISEHVTCEYTGIAKFCTGLVEMTPPILAAPPPPDLIDTVQMEL